MNRFVNENKKKIVINTLEDLYKSYPDDFDDAVTSMKWPNWLVRIVDFDRKSTKIPRSSWILTAVMEKVERQGYDVSIKLKK